jgi:hypothetical protein
VGTLATASEVSEGREKEGAWGGMGEKPLGGGADREEVQIQGWAAIFDFRGY